MKKILVVLLSAVLIIGLAGCMQVEEVITISDDGSGEISSTIMIKKEFYDSLSGLFGQADSGEDIFKGQIPETVSVDGVEYYKAVKSEKFNELDQLKSYLESEYKDVYISAAGVRYVMDAEPDISYEEAETVYAEMGISLKDAVTATIKVKMPEKILKVSKTGTISEDGYTATFILKTKDLFKTVDIMISTAKETVKPTINVTNKKTYTSAKTVTAKDSSGIKTAKYKKKNGKYYNFTISKTFTKNGTYTVTAEDYYGNKTVKSFTIKDTVKPKISGVTNKKTYTSKRTLKFTDNCEVKTVKLYINGDRIRLTDDDITNGVAVDETGSYKVVVTDVNGNSRTVNFKIK